MTPRGGGPAKVDLLRPTKVEPQSTPSVGASAVIHYYRYGRAPVEGDDSGEAIEQDENYPDQDQLEPPGSRMRFAGDILWASVTGFAFAAIIGILCWPISAVLSPRILAGATPASRPSEPLSGRARVPSASHWLPDTAPTGLPRPLGR
jgi:hypothetical protein